MKVFISYSRIDAKETANVIHEYLTKYGNHEVFIDTSNIPYGDNWNEVIQKEIADCNIFVIIVTPSALYRSEVEKEVELAKKLKKKIIPCIAKDYVEEDEIKWELNRYQGFFYDRDSKLAMDLHIMIKREAKIQRKISTTEVKPEIKTDDHSSISEKQNFGETKSTQSLLERAKGLEEIGQYSKALKAYDEAIKINPDNFEVYYNKGLLHEKIGDFEKAFEALDKATDRDWKHKDVWHHLGKVLEKLERYEEALDAFNTDLRIDDKDVKSWIAKADVLLKLEKYDEAIEPLEEILKVEPNHIQSWTNKGYVLQKLKMYHEAIDCYNIVLRDSNDQDSKKNKERVLYELKKIFSSLIDEANSYYENKNYAKVIELCDEAIDIDKENHISYLYKANSLQQLSMYEDAIYCYDKVLAIDANNEEAIKNKEISKKKLEEQELSICDFALACSFDDSPGYFTHEKDTIMIIQSKSSALSNKSDFYYIEPYIELIIDHESLILAISKIVGSVVSDKLRDIEVIVHRNTKNYQVTVNNMLFANDNSGLVLE